MLVSIWERILRVVPIGIEDHWYDLGGDSFAATVLFAEIEASLGKELVLSTLLRADTVAKLALLVDPAPTSRYPIAHIFCAEGKRPPLYCVHGVEGTPEFARLLSSKLGPDQPVVGFQARSLDPNLSDPPDNIAAIAADYLNLMRRHSRGPYHLMGGCAGAVIAFEMAQHLLAQGEEIARLILIDPLVTSIRSSNESVVDGAIERLRKMQPSTNLARARRDATIRTLCIMRRAAFSYQLRPYPGELAILCSDENFDTLATDNSEWRAAAGSSFVLSKIAPTHRSLVGECLPVLGAHVKRLLGSL
jgi:thioesterase domain-containing protein/acyl carrier protein